MSNKKSTKRALITSILAVAVCLIMLIGTTFAWFTDTASTSVNSIKSGTLGIALEMKDGENWVSAEGKIINFVKAEGHENDAVLWEPGCTYTLPELRVVNNGNLALKYKIQITGIKGDEKLNDAIEWTLSDDSLDSEHKLAAGKTSDVLTIKGHMKEDAGNEYQGLSIDGIAISVIATQDTVEYDSYDNQYDEDVEVITPNTVPSQFKANTTYFFGAGNYGDQTFVITEKENVTLIGNTGAKFDSLQISSIDYVNAENGQEVDLDNSTLTVKGFDVAKTLWIDESDKNVVVEDNTAAQITVKANVSSQSIVVNNNALTGGADAAQGYGVYIVPNVTDYDLTVTGNTFTNVKSHAIGVQGYGDGSAVTAAKSITVTGNTFTSYGVNNEDGRAAFKIWADTKLAPNGTDPLNDAATALAEAIETNNSFAADLGKNCVVANFYGKNVEFD